MTYPPSPSAATISASRTQYLIPPFFGIILTVGIHMFHHERSLASSAQVALATRVRVATTRCASCSPQGRTKAIFTCYSLSSSGIALSSSCLVSGILCIVPALKSPGGAINHPRHAVLLCRKCLQRCKKDQPALFGAVRNTAMAIGNHELSYLQGYGLIRNVDQNRTNLQTMGGIVPKKAPSTLVYALSTTAAINAMATTGIDADLYQVRLGSEVSGVTSADNLNRVLTINVHVPYGSWGVESHKNTGTPEAAELPTFALKDVLPDVHLASSCALMYKMPITRYVEYCDAFPTNQIQTRTRGARASTLRISERNELPMAKALRKK
eukprot:6214610-Amphidinium_carterae.1